LVEKGAHIPFFPDNTGISPAATKPQRFPAGQRRFDRVLEEALTDKKLNFSAHARQRLESRSIALGADEVGKLEEAVEKAAARGCRSSLLLHRDMA